MVWRVGCRRKPGRKVDTVGRDIYVNWPVTFIVLHPTRLHLSLLPSFQESILTIIYYGSRVLLSSIIHLQDGVVEYFIPL